LNHTFDNQAAQEIQSLSIVPQNTPDILRCVPSKNGICTTKSIYRCLAAQNQVQLPIQGSRSILPQVNHIMTKVWKIKQLPLSLKLLLGE